MLDITTETYKKPDIEVSSMDDAWAQDKVNTAFRSLYNQMTSYKKEETDQEFAVFKYRGSLRNVYSGTVPKPAKEVPLVGINEYGQQFNVGKINLNGQVIFNPIDTIRQVESNTEMEWQDVSYSLITGADFGTATFRIGGDGPTLLCNCLLMPNLCEGLNSTSLSQVDYCYNYKFTYNGFPFCYNDGSQCNDIIGWYTQGGCIVCINQNDWNPILLGCTCCVKTIKSFDRYEDEAGVTWTVCSNICSECVWETWQAIPDEGNPLDCFCYQVFVEAGTPAVVRPFYYVCIWPVLGCFCAYGEWWPFFYSNTGCRFNESCIHTLYADWSYNHCPWITWPTDDCVGYYIHFDGIRYNQVWVRYDDYSEGLLSNRTEPYIYACSNGAKWIRPIFWCFNNNATCIASAVDWWCCIAPCPGYNSPCPQPCSVPWYCLNTHHKESDICWNPNNTYFNKTMKNTNAVSATGLFGTTLSECNKWSSSCVKNFAKDCFGDLWNEGVQAIPYNKENYQKLREIWDEQSTYKTSYGGTYLDSWYYLACFCQACACHGYSGYSVWCPDAETGVYYVACNSCLDGYTPLYLWYSNNLNDPDMGQWWGGHYSASFWDATGDFVECVCQGPICDVDWCNVCGTPLGLYCDGSLSWCPLVATVCCVKSATHSANMAKDLCGFGLSCWHLEHWAYPRSYYAQCTAPYAQDWYNKYNCWIYTPYSYCRLTKVYCVCQHCVGTGKIEVGDVDINVRYRKARG